MELTSTVNETLNSIVFTGVILVMIASLLALAKALVLVGGLSSDRPFRRVLESRRSTSSAPISRSDIAKEALRVAAAAAGATMGGAVIASAGRVAMNLSSTQRPENSEEILDDIRRMLREEIALRDAATDDQVEQDASPGSVKDLATKPQKEPF